jgi:nitrogen fixation NifU-like protein
MLRELYHEVIIDHGRHPRNFGVLPNATWIQEGFNPLCGDKITLYLQENNGVIENITFQGSGCAISMASASLLTEVLRGKTLAQAEQLFADFHQMVTQHGQHNSEKMGKLAILAGVAEYPARVKCATLAWHALQTALQHKPQTVCTE